MRDQLGPETFDGQTPGFMSPVGWKSRYDRPLEDPNYRMHRIDLRFDHREVELRFLAAYRHSTLGFRRVGLAIGIASFAIFAPIDLFNSPDAWRALWAVRFWLVVPMLLLVLSASYWKRAQPFLGYLVNVALTISSLALIGMIHLSTRAAMAQNFEALLVLLPSAFSFLRLRVLGTTAASGIVLLAFAVETAALRPLPPVEMAYMMGFLLAACIVGIALAYLMERQTRLAYVLNASLDEASIRDPLTGLHNRRWLEVTLDQLNSTFRRYGAIFSMILIDLDGFKAVNDLMGYTQGDGLLKRFGQALSTQLRSSDVIFRYGGDEFIILSPATSGPGAEILVARLREQIRSLDLTEFEVSRPLEFSAGVAEVCEADEAASLFQRANRALRQAKRAGGGRTSLDQIEVAKHQPPTGSAVG